jgi:hypothetical protein
MSGGFSGALKISSDTVTSIPTILIRLDALRAELDVAMVCFNFFDSQ